MEPPGMPITPKDCATLRRQHHKDYRLLEFSDHARMIALCWEQTLIGMDSRQSYSAHEVLAEYISVKIITQYSSIWIPRLFL